MGKLFEAGQTTNSLHHWVKIMIWSWISPIFLGKMLTVRHFKCLSLRMCKSSCQFGRIIILSFLQSSIWLCHFLEETTQEENHWFFSFFSAKLHENQSFHFSLVIIFSPFPFFWICLYIRLLIAAFPLVRNPGRGKNPNAEYGALNFLFVYYIYTYYLEIFSFSCLLSEGIICWFYCIVKCISYYVFPPILLRRAKG